MKKLTFLTVLLILCSWSLSLSAAPLKDVPMVVIQPNGDTLHCFASGDEYFNYLHDAQGYTIMQNPSTGYYVYAQVKNQCLIATEYVAGKVSPTSVGLKKRALISSQEWRDLRNDMMSYQHDEVNNEEHVMRRVAATADTRNHGLLNNLVIFIRFSDETGFTSSLTTIQNNFNDSTTTSSVSLYNYFKTTSYDKLHIVSSFYPATTGTSILSYQDINARSYYQPYDSTTNTNGYADDEERVVREHSLLQRAVSYVSSSIPSSLNIDYNNDGYVDNICFVITGSPNGWSSLLWPHRWALYSQNVTINGKRVYDYNFTLETQVNTAVLCHEMQHTLSFPDLYHYNDAYDDISPVDRWDIMETTMTPPQLSGAYMKWKYGNWIEEPTTIMTPGTYTLTSLGQTTGTHAYRIPSSNANEYFVLEFRNPSDRFDSSIPGTGILVYRINDECSGNAQYDGSSTLDEVYIYRPNANTISENGSPLAANFGNGTQTSFNQTTNPRPFLSDGSYYNDLKISNMSYNGNTATFTIEGEPNDPTNFVIDSINSSSISLSWLLNQNRNVVLLSSTSPITDTLVTGTTYTAGVTFASGAKVIYAGNSTSFVHSSLNVATTYYYKLMTQVDNVSTWSKGVSLSAQTTCGVINSLPYIQNFDASLDIPSCFSQENESGYVIPWVVTDIDDEDISFGPYTTAAHSGTNFLSYYFATRSDNSNSVILPMFNLASYSQVNLSFWYTNANWAGDQNILIVKCRDSETSDWVVLDTLDTDVRTWTKQEYSLPNLSSTYQIALEGISVYGYATNIDDVMLSIPPVEISTNALPLQGGVVTGDGEYENGTQVILTATESTNYRFCGWSDGVTSNPRTITATQDSIFIALFCDIPVASLSADEEEICLGEYVQLIASSADSIFWYVNGQELVEKRQNTSLLAAPTSTTVYSIITKNSDILAGVEVECMDTAFQQIVVNATYNMPIEIASVNLGDTYQANGWYIQTSDSVAGSYTYMRYDATIDGCDSILNLRLNVLSPTTVNLSKTICESQLPYVWNSITFTEAGVQTAQIDAEPTDSLIIMQLNVNPSYEVSESRVICTAQLPYVWNGVTFTGTETQTLTANLTTTSGCDSIINMTVYKVSAYMGHDYRTICENDLPYTWNDSVFTEQGTKMITTQTVAGCDSVTMMHLTVMPKYEIDTFVTANTQFIWNNVTYNQTGDYVEYKTTVNGCDSIINLHLIITNTTGINNIVDDRDAHLMVYPNPAKSYIVIDNIMPFVGKDLIITDYVGNVVIKTKVTEQPFSVSIESLVPGTYVIWIENEAVKVIKK